MKNIVVASHVALVDGKEYDGLGNVVIENLSVIAPGFSVIRHSMDGLLPSEIRHYRAGQMAKSERLFVIAKPALLRYIMEFMATVLYFTFRQRTEVFVGIDPLNAITGVVLKKLGRIKRTVFFTPDYSPERFSNQVLNKIYHKIDRYCVKNADEVWSVSTKITAIRREMGLPEEKNIFVPNVPPVEYDGLRKNKHNKYNLITTGIVDRQLDSARTIEAVALLKDKMPKLSFTIIGNGPEEKRLKELARTLRVSDRVYFKGRLPLGETLEYVSKAGIGLALYTGVWSFNQFGDSTKSREFFNFGLPVISTNTHATVDEMRQFGAGLVVEQDVQAYVRAIEAIIKNYAVFSAASRQLGVAHEGIHKKELLRLIAE